MSSLTAAILCVAGAAFAAPTPPAKPAPKAAAQPAAPPAEDKSAAAKDDAGKADTSGLPLPRFVSLRSEPVNLRTGPGMRYPVDWVYRRRHLPVEVIAEFETWRKIRDPDGAEGWLHSTMIAGKRTAMVKGETRRLRRTSTDESDRIADLEPGVIVNLNRCPPGPYCRVEVNGLQGWLKRDEMWGVYPDEPVE